MFMVASSVVLTVVVLNYHHRTADIHEMPPWVNWNRFSTSEQFYMFFFLIIRNFLFLHNIDLTFIQLFFFDLLIFCKSLCTENIYYIIIFYLKFFVRAFVTFIININIGCFNGLLFVHQVWNRNRVNTEYVPIEFYSNDS